MPDSILKGNGMEWQKVMTSKANWRTPEQIQVKPVYTKEDLEAWSI